MHKILFTLLLFILCTSLFAQSFYKGADLSFVKQLEDCGVKWKENNTTKDIFSIFKDRGANLLRYRLWHTPVSGRNGLTETESLISRAHENGFKTILDFHYSDTWTDAGHQKCPAAWQKVVDKPASLADSIYNYTKYVLNSLKDKGLMPEFVQVGNETNGGLCFGGNGTVTWPTDWSRQTQLFNAGIKAVREIDPACKIILHVAGPQNAEWWAGELKKNNVTNYDIFGISFYPLLDTTTTINQIGTIISDIKKNYQKDVMIVETALPWTDKWDDDVTNFMNGTPAGYGDSSSPENQAKWLKDLSKKVQSSGGIGVIYWEPDWVASHVNGCVSDYNGSTWENSTFFDFDNNLINNGGIQFIGNGTSIEKNSFSDSKKIKCQLIIQNGRMRLKFTSPVNSTVNFDLLNIQGRKIASFSSPVFTGENDIAIRAMIPIELVQLCLIRIKSDEHRNSTLVLTPVAPR